MSKKHFTVTVEVEDTPERKLTWFILAIAEICKKWDYEIIKSETTDKPERMSRDHNENRHKEVSKV